jgi:hypothetical protein
MSVDQHRARSPARRSGVHVAPGMGKRLRRVRAGPPGASVADERVLTAWDGAPEKILNVDL